MKKILQILLITILALSGFFYPQSTIGVKHPSVPPPLYEIWHTSGINNEPNLSVLFKNKGQTTSIDMCYLPNGRIYAVWIDTNSLGKPVPCYAFFDQHGWKYLNSKGEKENGYCYIGYDLFQNKNYNWSATKIRIASIHNKVIAVYLVKTKIFGQRLFYSILYDGNDIPGINILCNPVNSFSDEGQEDSPDLGKITNSIILPSTFMDTLYMTYTKEINGKNEVCVTRFVVNYSTWCPLNSTTQGFTTVNSNNIYNKSNPRIAFRKEDGYFPFSIVYQATVATGINNVFYTRYDMTNIDPNFHRFVGLSATNNFTPVSNLTNRNRTQPHLAFCGGEGYYIVWVESGGNGLSSNVAFAKSYDDYFIEPGSEFAPNPSPGYLLLSSFNKPGTKSNSPFIHSLHEGYFFQHTFTALIAWDQTKDPKRTDTITKVTFYIPFVTNNPLTGRLSSFHDRGKRYTEIKEIMSSPYDISYDTYSQCRIAEGGFDTFNGHTIPKPIIFGICMGENGEQDTYFGNLTLRPGINPPTMSSVQAKAKLSAVPNKPPQNWQFVNNNGSYIEIQLSAEGFYQPPSPNPTLFLYAYFNPPLQYKKMMTPGSQSIPKSLMFKSSTDPFASWIQGVNQSTGEILINDLQEISLIQINPYELDQPDIPDEILKMTFFTNTSQIPSVPNLPSQHYDDSNNALPLHFYNFFWIDSQNGNLPTNLPLPNYQLPLDLHRAFVGFCISEIDFVIADNLDLSVDRGWYVETNVKFNNPYEDYPNFIYSFFVENPEELTGLTISFSPQEDIFNSKGEAFSFVVITVANDAPLSSYIIKVKCMILSSPKETIPMAFCFFKIGINVKTPIMIGQKNAKKSYSVIGDYVDYILTVKNIGDGSAHLVEILDPLPRELRFVSSMPDATLDGTSLKWKIDILTPGQSFSIRLRTKIRDDLGLSPGYIIVNTARFKSQNEGFSSNVSVMIQPSIPGSISPQAELVIKNIKKGNIIYANEPIEGTLKVLAGAGPFTATIMWGDSTKAEVYAIGETNIKTVSHTFEQPGDYTIITTVRDDYGKFTNIYKHIRVISK
jgi:uncharacterized repeat protein (TIGR01451 family)